MKAADFRKELVKTMPGYDWTIHKSGVPERYMLATGTQSSGSNRLSTLNVEWRDDYASSGKARYEVKSSGYGKRAMWLHTESDQTLKSALRRLQDHYERVASLHSSHADSLRVGRIANKGDTQ